MKTSNFVALLMAVMVSTAGFAGVDYLFTRPASWHQHHSADLMLHALPQSDNIARPRARAAV
jgi:hypothetical protein